MSEFDISAMEDEIRSTARRIPISEYAPKRVAPEPEPAAPGEQAQPNAADPLSEEIRQNALRVTTMIGNLQHEKKQLEAQLNHANARIEQFESRIRDLEEDKNNLRNELESVKNTNRLAAEQAQREIQAERAEQVRLTTLLETIGGSVADALHGRK